MLRNRLRLLCFLRHMLFLDDGNSQSSTYQQHTCHYHHVTLVRAYHPQYVSATKSCHNLRNTDSAVEESEVSTHVSITLQSIGDKGERHRQHSCPASTNHQERNELQVLVVQEWDKGKAHTTDNQADRISHLGTLELGKHYHPQHTAHSLNGKENAHPVAGILECLSAGIGSIPYGLGNGTRRIVPQTEEALPAEELHQAHLPESGRSIAQERNPISLAFLFLFHFTSHAIIGSILLRIPLLHLHRGIDDTEN